MFQCTHLIVGDAETAQNSYKGRTAVNYGIPVVLPKYLEACIDKGRLLDTDPFIVLGNSKAEELSSGKIVGMAIFSQRIHYTFCFKAFILTVQQGSKVFKVLIFLQII